MAKQPTNTLLGIRKLPPRALFILVPFFLSLVMSGIVSFISTVKSLGFSSELISTWLVSWLISWVIAFPTVLFVLPIARKVSLFFVRSELSE
nr:DUF2798 domain-containing protein [uncultured Moellerella sp.]